MLRPTQRWIAIGLATWALLATSARADDPRVALYYGPEGPFRELLGAELGLVGFELRPGPPPAPIDEGEALALFDETGAAAVLDHHRGSVSLWVRPEGSVQRATVEVSDDPGIAPLVIAETLRAALPMQASPPPRPVQPPTEWTAPPPRIATESTPPPEPTPERAPRFELVGGPMAVYGGRWSGGATLEATVRLHPALSAGAFAFLTGSPAMAGVLRVDGHLGRLRLSLDAGPAVWWRQQPANDGSVALRASPSWTAGVGTSAELGERWSVSGRVGLLRAGPRHRVGEQEAVLTLALGLGARF